MFKVNKENLNLIDKFINLLNDIDVQKEIVEEIVDNDNTLSGDINVTYQLKNGDIVRVDKDKIVRYEETNETLEEGNYLMLDGNILSISDLGTFVETKTYTEGMDIKNEEVNEIAESPVTASEVVETVETEIVQEELVNTEEKEEELKEDIITQEVIEIEGVEYQVPKEVLDYINTLKTERDEKDNKIEELNKEVVNLSEVTPSTQPIVSSIGLSDNKTKAKSYLEKLNSIHN